MSDAKPASTQSGIATTALAEMPPENVGSVIGPYKLLQQIGQGGFGVVYMAEQEKPVRRVVALKIIKPGMDTSQVIARFESERQALALMDHPNIAKVLDAGTTASGHPYFVMELVKGLPITEYCDKNHLAPDGRLKLFVDVCHAIQHAHQKGIIHRDIKPSNVMVTLHDGAPVVKVIDFGVAKATVQKLTERTLFTAYGQMIGTPEYMSPEQAEMTGLDIDTRSDIYSLGVLLYELLTGTTPFDRKRLAKAAYDEVIRIIRDEEPLKPSTRLSQSTESLPAIAAQRKTDPVRLSKMFRGDLDWITMKALDKDRARRYDTAGAFAADIVRHLHDEPVEAGPPSTGYRLRKLARRYRTLVITGAAFATLLIAAAIVSTWFAFAAERSARLAADQAENADRAYLVADAQQKQAEAEKRRVVAAAEAEKKARDNAMAREAETKAVLSFVENRIFAAARPAGQEGGLGRDVTLRAAIESALPYVEKGFAKEPLIEAQLRLTLAQSFRLLGNDAASLQQAQAARALYTRHLGPDASDTLASMEAEALADNNLGRYQDALNRAKEILSRRTATLGADHADTIRSMWHLGMFYTGLDRYEDATGIFERASALAKVRLGGDHPETLTFMFRLADCYRHLDRYTDAIRLCEETLRIQNARLGPDHPDTLKTMSLLAICYRDVGRLTDALELEQKTLTLQKAKLGSDHPATLSTMALLATIYVSLGRVRESLELQEETLALLKVKLGPSHINALIAMNNLAESYFLVGRQAEAVKLAEETLSLKRESLGPDHPTTLSTASTLADFYMTLGRHDDALKLNQETLALRTAKLGSEDRDTLKSMWRTAKNLVAVHRAGEAVQIIRQATVAWEKIDRRSRLRLYDTACIQAVAATVLRANGKGSDATRESDQAVSFLKQAVAAGYSNVADIKGDTDLDSLRDRDDFKKLVADLERKSGDKAK